MPDQFVKTLILLGSLVSVLGTTLSCAKTFNAEPGTNTLIAMRDTVRAWRTAKNMPDSVIVQLARGNYTLTEPLILTAQDSNVTWLAREPEHTIISGGQEICDFTPDRTGIWHAKTDLHFEQLYVNGHRALRARMPAEGFLKFNDVTEKKLPDDKARITAMVASAAIAALPTNDTINAAQLLVYHKWDTTRYALSAVDRSNNTIAVIGAPMKPWNPWNQESRFVLDNCPAGLIQPGSWFLAATGDLNYHPRPTEHATNTEFAVPTIEKFLEIRGASNLHFRGLKFQFSGYWLPAEGCPPTQAAAMIGASIEIDDAQNVSFENCRIAHTGNYGIWFRRGCRNGRIEHCLLEDLGAGGIRIGEAQIRDIAAQQTGGIIVNNNIIRGCGRIHPSAVGIWIGQSANNRVTHNDISDTFYSGISAGWTWGYGRSLATNNFIGFNRIHEIGQGALSDMGGIYTLGISSGSACIGNVIFDVRAHDYGGWGIYPDEGSTGWQIISNLVCNCTSGGRASTGGSFHQHYGATNLVVNNIFAFNSGPPMQATRAEDHLSFTLEHNLIVTADTPFFTGPWEKIQFQSASNCFACTSPHEALFPNGNLVDWQNAGHEMGSIFTNIQFTGTWPDVTLPHDSPAFKVGFEMFNPSQAGVYGSPSWKETAEDKE